MQFTVAASMLFAAIAAASPSSPVQARQARSVTATFYKSVGCNIETDVITPPSPLPLVQDTLPCHNITIGQTVGCTKLTDDSLTLSLRVYNKPDCPETGDVNFWTYTGNVNDNKFNQDVKSYRFVPRT